MATTKNGVPFHQNLISLIDNIVSNKYQNKVFFSVHLKIFFTYKKNIIVSFDQYIIYAGLLYYFEKNIQCRQTPDLKEEAKEKLEGILISIPFLIGFDLVDAFKDLILIIQCGVAGIHFMYELKAE